VQELNISQTFQSEAMMLMRNFTMLFVFLVMSGIFLTACAKRYPLDMTEAEWQALPPEKKMEAQKAQAKLDAEAAERRAREKTILAERKAKAERQRLADIKSLYSRGMYRDFVQCVVQNPLVDLRPGWTKMQPTGFILARQEEREVSFQPMKGNRRASIWALYSGDGLKVTLCRYNPSHPFYSFRNQCDSIVATHSDYERGVSKSISMPDRLQGTLECSYAPGKGMPSPIVIEHR